MKNDRFTPYCFAIFQLPLLNTKFKNLYPIKSKNAMPNKTIIISSRKKPSNFRINI